MGYDHDQYYIDERYCNGWILTNFPPRVSCIVSPRFLSQRETNTLILAQRLSIVLFFEKCPMGSGGFCHLPVTAKTMKHVKLSLNIGEWTVSTAQFQIHSALDLLDLVLHTIPTFTAYAKYLELNCVHPECFSFSKHFLACFLNKNPSSSISCSKYQMNSWLSELLNCSLCWILHHLYMLSVALLERQKVSCFCFERRKGVGDRKEEKMQWLLVALCDSSIKSVGLVRLPFWSVLKLHLVL